ncbi:MAG: metallophosphoesterase [Planctomycetota bacterium]|nr:metallophosphoesterase [Planctomycetota bacterium]
MTATHPLDSPDAPRLVPRRYSGTRIAFLLGVERVSRFLGGRAFYRRAYLARGRFRVRHERVAVRGLPRGLEGFRIAHLSDFHGGSFLGPGDLAAVVEETNALAPDLVALTGDYITHHWSEALRPLEDLARLRARHGVFAVFGNHDYRERKEDKIAAAYAERGIRFLRNECARVDTGDGVLAVVGIEDLEESKTIDLGAARAPVEEGDVELVLLHNPRGAGGVVRPGCAVVLSGHTHGHQIDLPLIRRIGPTHPGDRQDLNGTAVITSRGLGVIGIPLRLFSPAEVVVVELRAGEEAHRAG